MNKLILVVEDDRNTSDFLELVLTAEGYTVTVCPVLSEAGSAALSVNPDMIFLASQVGGTDTAQYCKMLKTDPLTRDIPVVALFEKGASIRETDRFTADDFMLKPLNIHVLLDVAEEHLCAKIIQFRPLHISVAKANY